MRRLLYTKVAIQRSIHPESTVSQETALERSEGSCNDNIMQLQLTTFHESHPADGEAEGPEVAVARIRVPS